MSDAAARATSLDPARSFIVQAPAGSGKTELLIQRYLALLATVDQPEQVVAITFTRKAAAEMRRRVQDALRGAAQGRSATRAHEQTTLRFASAVIARDAQSDWTLLTQPQRLRIDTLDAFNASLAQQLPVLADGVAAAAIVDKPEQLYHEAARRAIGAVIGNETALVASLRTLLLGVDNDTERLEQLLAALLARRDQWLQDFAGVDATALRPALEGALQRLVDDEVAVAAAACPAAVLEELAPLLRHAAGAAAEALRARLAPWLAIERPPHEGPLALAAWRGVAALLLTKEGEWRKRITRAEGFGPQHTDLRDRCYSLLERCRVEEPLRRALASVASLPEGHYSESQWHSLTALRAVLLRLAAELKVVFAERHVVDFVELALAARRALGQVDAPSDLLLALDRRIQHILVDEFQDTSHSQLRLIELLTAGWQADDGRTLFLVGDPMQSIYRFRDADMSLFLRAKQRGIGNIALTSLTLESNFRAAPAIVDWVNSVFAGVFPREDRIESGIAAFRASHAVRDGAPGQFVATAAVASTYASAEVERVIEILAAERERSAEQSIAVLVQSRSHLEGLRERLRARGWPVHAVEIDTLDEQQVAQDLAGLTRALTHPADKIAWLGVLRAPWCGLRWVDLVALCDDAGERSVYEILHDAARIERLDADARARIGALTTVLANAFAQRHDASLARWVERTWRDLDGPACLDDNAELQAADQYFALLAAAERHGDLDDPAQLHVLLTGAQPQADPPREQGVEIMTMHRAKGLEFDTVVLLGLAREPRPDEPKALQWLPRVAADGHEDLLIVPAATIGDDAGARLTDFVRRAERERDLAERARLLYVATTRARERLHLVWRRPPSGAEPHPGSMLAHLKPVLAVEPPESETPPMAADTDSATITPTLRRLELRAGPTIHAERACGRARVRVGRTGRRARGHRRAPPPAAARRARHRSSDGGRHPSVVRELRARALAARRRASGARERRNARRGRAHACAHGSARPLGARRARGSAQRIAAHGAQRRVPRALATRSDVRRGRQTLDRRLQDEPARGRRSDGVPGFRGRALPAAAGALCTCDRRDRRTTDPSRAVLPAARGVS
jgi:ATP-dependent helicase/nuclease subunit A